MTSQRPGVRMSPARVVLGVLAVLGVSLIPPPGAAAEYRQLALGWSHSCGLTAAGRIVCWGANGEGQRNAPQGTFTEVSAGGTTTCALKRTRAVVCWGSPQTPGPAAGTTFRHIAVGFTHACGISATTRHAVCWGYNYRGATEAPHGTFAQLSAGHEAHTCALTAAGRARCWGDDSNSQATPPRVSFRSISAGAEHTCGVSTGRRVVCWGRSDSGETRVPRGRWIDVAAGDAWTCGIKVDRQLHCWGAQAIVPPAGRYAQVEAGPDHACALDVTRHVACWGDGGDGRSLPPRGPGA